MQTTIMIVAFVLFVIAVSVFLFRRNPSNQMITIDEYTTNFFMNQLNEIIDYKSVYHIDSKFGENFSVKNKITSDIDNDELANSLEKVIEDIYETIPEISMKYLIYLNGEKWLSDYIRIRALSIFLNYSEKTIEDLTSENFK